MPDAGADLPVVGHTLYERAVIYDSGAFVALASSQDQHHAEARACLNTIAADRLPTFVTTATIHESHRRILSLHGQARARDFLASVGDGTVAIVRPTLEEDQVAIDLIDRYPYLELSLTDALTVAVMTSRSIGRVFSFDDHFFRLGALRVPPL